MSNFMNTLGWPLFAATGFVLWPIASRMSGLSPMWSIALVMVGSSLTLIPFAAPALASEPSPHIKGIMWVLVAGLINGLALYIYTTKAVDTKINVVAFMCTVTVLMVLLVPLMNYLFKKEVPDLKQGVGLLLGAISVYLLTQK